MITKKSIVPESQQRRPSKSRLKLLNGIIFISKSLPSQHRRTWVAYWKQCSIVSRRPRYERQDVKSAEGQSPYSSPAPDRDPSSKGSITAAGWHHNYTIISSAARACGVARGSQRYAQGIWITARSAQPDGGLLFSALRPAQRGLVLAEVAIES